jgi:purine-binding chemotaxis protein CheW
LDIRQIERQMEDTQHGRYLTFTLGEEVFGIEIRFVTEIVGMQPITRMPQAPAYMKGIINLRGKIIPVIDMRLKFQKEPIEYDDRTCVIIVEVDGLSGGLIVDQVDEVITISDEDTIPPPSYGKDMQNYYVANIGKVKDEIKLLLDCGRIFQNTQAGVIGEPA